MVGLNNKRTQVHYSEFHAFGNHVRFPKRKNNRMKILF